MDVAWIMHSMLKMANSFLLTVAIGSICGAAAFAQNDYAPTLRPAFAPDSAVNTLNTLPNFHQITPTLFRGGQPSATDLAKLKSAGVKTVIDFRNEEVLVRQEAQQAKSLGLDFVSIPLDVFNPPSDAAVNAFLKLTDDRSRQPMYIHCLHGQDRTGTLAAIFRIERQGWSADQAYAEMLACGFRPGFARLSEAVFAHGAKAGRPGHPPTAGDMVRDLQNRLRRKKN